jgi:site-specific DNA-methyltransferase (adenine-specific)
MDVKNVDGWSIWRSQRSIDLILTDPPYIISRESGMNPTTTQLRKRREQRRVRKTEDEWNAYKEENGLPDDSKKKKNI